MKYPILMIFLIVLIGCHNRDIKVNNYPVTHITNKPLVINESDTSEMPDSIQKLIRFRKNKNDYDFNAYKPGLEYGGFFPKYPMLLLISSGISLKTLKYGEGMMPMCYEIMIKNGNKYVIISDKNDLKNIFAPIDNVEEAISFVCALTHSEPLYKFDFSKKNKYFKKQLFKTYVTQIGTDYVVHLFHFDYFGCPPHEMFEITYLVHKNGDIKELSKEKIFEDTENRMCVD
jgi:hypothetical protein